MNELIKVTENNGQSVVSARELHMFLEVKTDFTDWMKRMLAYGFEELTDYSLLKIGERSAHNKTDYALTIDTAKEISMIQRSDKGRQARRYFIECEKIAKQATALPTLLQQIEQERMQLIQQRDSIDSKLSQLTNATRYITNTTEQDEWEDNFVKTYDKYTLDFIKHNIEKWVSDQAVRARFLRDSYYYTGGELGIKSLLQALREYGKKHKIYVDTGRQSRLTGENHRIHIFSKMI